MRPFALLLAVAVLICLTGCDDAVNPPAEATVTAAGTISGTVQLDPHTEGTVEGTVVHIYGSIDDAQMMRATLSVVVDQNGQFAFENVLAGKYYVGAWKDTDGNGQLSSGDLSTDRTNHENCCCQVTSGLNTQMCPYISVVQ
jgi:uncharacterized protein (DUF2141 family)